MALCSPLHIWGDEVLSDEVDFRAIISYTFIFLQCATLNVNGARRVGKQQKCADSDFAVEYFFHH